MTEQEWDALMRRGLLEALEQDWQEPLQTLPPLEPSARYQRELQRLLQDPAAWLRRRTRPAWKKALQIAAAFAVAATLTVAAVPPARAAVLRWVKEVSDRQIVYRYLDDGTDVAERSLPQYRLTYVPEGYVENEELQTMWDGLHSMVYENAEGKQITFWCTKMQEGIVTSYGTGETVVSDIEVNGCKGQLFLSPDNSESSLIYWIDEEAGIQFDIMGFLDEVELRAMAESVAAAEQSLPQYRLTYVPEGYQKDGEVQSDWSGFRSIAYDEKTGEKRIVFICTEMKEGAVTGLILDSAEAFDTEVNGWYGQLFLSRDKADSNGITWMDEDQGVQFTIIAYTGEEELRAMAESVTVVED